MIFVFKCFDLLFRLRFFHLYLFFYDLYKSISERKEIKRLKNEIKPGQIVVDAGANVGFYTRLFSQIVGPSGKVYAFEPDPKNFEVLKFRTSKLENVVTENKALTDKTKMLFLFLSPAMNVDHQCYDGNEGRQGIEIEGVALDEYFEINKLNSLDFIKSDLQGYDHIAFQGMKKLIQKNMRLKICVEFWPYGIKKSGGVAINWLKQIEEVGLIIDRTPDLKEDYGAYSNLWLAKV